MHAIITGDIVASRSIETANRKKLYEDLSAFLKSLKKQWISGYSSFRGDSIQCQVKSVGASLRVALMIRCYVMAYQFTAPAKKKRVSQRGYFTSEFDIRLAIGIGKVDFIEPKNLAASDGEAFQLSGESLDELKQDYQRMVLRTADAEMNARWDPVVALIDALTQKWTQNQAELVLHKLQNKKDDDVRKSLGITLSAVTQRKKNAQWMAIEKALDYFEETMKFNK